jgi:hypothetical protein
MKAASGFGSATKPSEPGVAIPLVHRNLALLLSGDDEPGADLKRSRQAYWQVVIWIAISTTLGIVWGTFVLGQNEYLYWGRSFVGDIVHLPLIIGVRFGSWLDRLGVPPSPPVLAPVAGAFLGLAFALIVVITVAIVGKTRAGRRSSRT